MSFFLLPSIQYNNQLFKHIQLDNLFKPYKSKIHIKNKEGGEHDNDNDNDNDNDIIINKTLYKYLSLIKEQIDDRIEQWDKYKKYTNPYEYIHSIIPNSKQSISTLKPISRSFFKMI